MSAWTWVWYQGKEVEAECPALEEAQKRIKELENTVRRLEFQLRQAHLFGGKYDE
jgi:hypothetical protein